MKPLFESVWKQRVLFFIGGVAISGVCMCIQFMSMSIVPYATFDQQPDWLKALKKIIGWFPWFAFAIVLILRIAKWKSVRVFSYLLGTAIPLVLLVGWLILEVPVSNYLHRQSFNAELWRTQESTDHDTMWPPRLCMVDDLMASGQLKSLTKAQVIQLLGSPHPKNFPGGAQSCDIHYYLGPERGFIRIDSEWLFLTFGEDGRVARYWIYRD